jgi:hypothetical protein
LDVPKDEEKIDEKENNNKRRLSAKTLTSVVQQFRLRRTKTSSCLQ